MDPSRLQIFIGLISSIAGGLLVAIINFLSTRKKTRLESKRLELEIEKLKIENEKLKDSFVKLNSTVQAAINSEQIYKIKFNYTDTPLNHGWQITERIEEGEPDLRSLTDGFRGWVWEIRRKSRYAMDFNLNPTTGLGTSIEFVVKLEEEAACLYAQVVVQKRGSSQRGNLWFQFVIGHGRPRQKYDHNSDFGWEWKVDVMPEVLDGNWQRFRVNLAEIVQNSVGNEGWEFTKQIVKLRLRGNLSIHYISIFN